MGWGEILIDHQEKKGRWEGEEGIEERFLFTSTMFDAYSRTESAMAITAVFVG
jgi:hypothetical protein